MVELLQTTPLMDPLHILGLTGRRQRNRQQGGRSSSAPPPSTSLTALGSAVYGYSNRFHTHAGMALETDGPPAYDSTDKILSKSEFEPLPSYSCSLSHEGPVSLKTELITPFAIPAYPEWTKVWARISGTMLSLHRLDSKKQASRGKPIRSFTLQHAVVGIALDVRPEVITTPRILSCFTKPPQKKTKYEWVIRLRVESSQIIISLPTEEIMLDWIDALCASIDISQPLEDREEPRYRSLPRRRRRQRALEQAAQGGEITSMEEDERTQRRERLVRQQEAIMRRLYPGLLSDGMHPDEQETPSRPASNDGPHTHRRTESTGIYETEGLDAHDILGHEENETDNNNVTASFPAQAGVSVFDLTTNPESASPKDATRPPISPQTLLRYRRRCAPVLLAISPRISDIIMHEGKRVRLDVNRCKLRTFEILPPAYSSHQFDKSMRSQSQSRAAKATGSEADVQSGLEIETEHETDDAMRPLVRREISNTSMESESSVEAIRPLPTVREALDGTADRVQTPTTPKDVAFVLKTETQQVGRKLSVREAGEKARLMLSDIDGTGGLGIM